MNSSPDIRRLLLVEDDVAIGDLLARFLGISGYAVTRASTRAQALSLLRAQQWEVLLTDENLPDGSGAEVATAARAQTEALPIVSMTALPEPLHASTIDGHLAKPFASLTLVLSTLELACERRELSRTREDSPDTVREAAAPPTRRTG